MFPVTLKGLLSGYTYHILSHWSRGKSLSFITQGHKIHFFRDVAISSLCTCRTALLWFHLFSQDQQTFTSWKRGEKAKNISGFFRLKLAFDYEHKHSHLNTTTATNTKTNHHFQLLGYLKCLILCCSFPTLTGSPLPISATVTLYKEEDQLQVRFLVCQCRSGIPKHKLATCSSQNVSTSICRPGTQLKKKKKTILIQQQHLSNWKW